MNRLDYFLRLVDTISESVGKFFSFILPIIMFIIVYETIMRYGFNSPTTWVNELSINLISPYFLFGGAYALLKQSHVNMDLFYSRFSLRTRATLDVFTSILFYCFIGVLFWKGLDWSVKSLKTLDNSGPPLYFPTYPSKLLLPTAAFLFLLQGSAKFVRDLFTSITGENYGR